MRKWNAFFAGKEEFLTLKWTRRSRPMALAAVTHHIETQKWIRNTQIHTSQGTSRRNRFGRGTYTWWDWSARPNTSPVTKNKNDRPVRTESNDGKHEQREKEGGREGEREREISPWLLPVRGPRCGEEGGGGWRYGSRESWRRNERTDYIGARNEGQKP
jgi:hypothetical protein